MVVFTCNACGESLKKNQVEKHCQTQCRNCQSICCVDCLKDFWGDEYKQHTKCMTEEARYSGKNYVPKPNANKGEVKQDKWIQQVQDAIEASSSNPRLRPVLERLKDYPNIPRKKQKFENFLSNCLRIRDQRLAVALWDVLMTKTQQSTDENRSVQSSQQNSNHTGHTEEQMSDRPDKSGDATADHDCTSKKLIKKEKKEERRKKAHKQEKKDKNDERTVDGNGADGEQVNGTELDGERVSKKKKKKRKHNDGDDTAEKGQNGEGVAAKKRKQSTETEEDVSTSETLETSQSLEDSMEESGEPETKRAKAKFDWISVITTLLKARGDKEMGMKKLRKKVLSEFVASGAFAKSEEKLWSMFAKKVNKNPCFKVHKDKVKLVS